MPVKSFLQLAVFSSAALFVSAAAPAEACLEGGPVFDSDTSFVFSWDVGTRGKNILFLPGGTAFDFYVDWGDGTPPTHAKSKSRSLREKTVKHRYKSTGSHTVTINGDAEAMRFFGPGLGETCVLTEVLQLGDLGWRSMAYMFATCADLRGVKGGDVSGVTDMRKMFAGARVAAPETSRWDLSSVQDMSGMFLHASAADPDTSNWDVSSVTDMKLMFSSTERATPDTSNWDVSSVTDMSGMFMYAFSADPDTSNWDVSSVLRMAFMFAEALEADPDTRGWDVSGVEDNMEHMFLRSPEASRRYRHLRYSELKARDVYPDLAPARATD